MRLCRRHGWVRADLQNGELNLTSAAQLETAFAGAERQSRQQPRGDGVRQRGETGQPPGGGRAPVASPIAQAQAVATRTGEPPEPAGSVAPVDVAVADPCAAAAKPSTVARNKPVAAPSRADATAATAPTGAPPSVNDTEDRDNQDSRGGSILTKPNSTRRASPPPAPPSTVASAAATMPQDPAANAAPCTPPPPQDVHSTADLPDVLAPVPLLDPQRQRELIKQAAGMSTRELAGLIAAVAPEVTRPRDTLRAVGRGRYTLKANINAECERGLRMLKDLLSHLDARMTWGDLVARLVREAVERHDPSGGGRNRRQRASSSGASSQRTQAAEGGAGRTATRRPAARGATPAPEYKTVAARQHRDQSAVTAPTTGSVRQRATRPHPASAHRVAAAPGASAARTPAPPSAPATSAQSVRAEVGATTDSSAGASTDSTFTTSLDNGPAGRAARTASAVTSGPEKMIAARQPQHDPVPAPYVDPRSPQAGPGSAVEGARAGADLATDATHGARRPRRAGRRRAIPAAVRRFVWERDQGRCCYVDPISGRRCNSSHLLQIDHLLPVAQGGGAEPSNLRL